MKYFHLTIIRDGQYQTLFGSLTSLENFLAIELELGRQTHILYSRELSESEYEVAKENKLMDKYYIIQNNL